MSNSGAMTIAEGNPDFKVGVNIVLNGGSKVRNNVLRTTLDSLSVWKAKHSVSGSAFSKVVGGQSKEASIIDRELWVFSIYASNPLDIYTAVSIAKDYYKVSAKEIIRDVYVKNLNAEKENEMETNALVAAYKSLYQSVSQAIVEAARKLGVSGGLNLWVFSNNKNPKIPKDDLYGSLRGADATSVETDKKRHQFYVGSNDGRGFQKFLTNLHLAKFNL